MLVNSYGFIFIYTCIHVDTLSAHTQKSELQYKYWYKFHFFFQKTINIVKHIMALHGLPFLSHVQYLYSSCNKSYLFTQFLFYEWQSLCLVQLLYFGDSNLILLPMFLLYKNIYIYNTYRQYIIFLFLNWDSTMLTMICYRKQNSAI